MKQEKSCGGIIFFKESKQIIYLLLKHANGHHWDFAKGHVESGESEKETALREIKEETKLNVTVIDGFREKVVYSPAKDVIKTVVYFICETSTKDVAICDELTDFIWLEFSEALNKLTYENSKKILKKANTFLEN